LTATKVEYRLLLKRKITRPQVDCSGAERLKNLKNAFCIKNSDNLQGKRILLIDDVYTTGATTYECTKALLEAGAKDVIVLCATISKEYQNMKSEQTA